MHAPSGPAQVDTPRQDADYVFYELTRSICPDCRRPIDAQIVLRDGKVFMRKRCPEHGRFEALVYGDARAYTSQSKFNKPGTIPLAFTTQIENGCPHDCGLCPDHQQHACLGIIEINSACNIADALPVEQYIAGCESAGLRVDLVDEHDEALAEMVRDIRGRLLGARMMAGLKHGDLPAVNWPQVTAMARSAARAVEAGMLGYALVIATKSAPPAFL